MKKEFNVFKGLQRPLIYKGFKGKYIFWGLGSLVGGLAIGAILASAVSSLLGAFVGVGVVLGGLFYTASQQKKGLHSKRRENQIYVPEIRFNRGLNRISKMKDKLLIESRNGKKEII